MKTLEFLKLKAIILIFCLSGCFHSGKRQDFVSVEGANFKLANKRYLINGVNFWQAAYLGADLTDGGKERLVRELDLLSSYGVNNLRIMASSEESVLKMSLSPAFQNKPGNYNDTLLGGLDFLLNEMGKHNMKAIMVMNNYWQWSGGMAQYLNWATNDSIIDPDVSGNWHGFMTYSAGFYYNRRAKELYDQYLNYVINRKNTINNKLYYNDPVIMAWELANEPRPHPQSLKNSELLKNYYRWIDLTAKYIHKLAPFQLVTIGSEGLVGSLGDSAIYFHSHLFPSVDYITFHLWPKNWGWFKADQQEKTLPLVLKNAADYYHRHVTYAKLIQKPTVLEEFGIGRDNEKYRPGTSVAARDTFLEIIYDMVENDIQSGKPIAGTNIWTWGGEGRAENISGIWTPGSSYTGDPPQEPQGLNSIFDVDTSTLNLIKKHANILKTFE